MHIKILQNAIFSMYYFGGFVVEADSASRYFQFIGISQKSIIEPDVSDTKKKHNKDQKCKSIKNTKNIKTAQTQCLSGFYMELTSGVEPPTSSLPMKCSAY